jgi:D-3-phosphoglycerate dehydrogenase
MAKIIFTTSNFDLSNFSDRYKVESKGFDLLVNPFGKRLTEDQLAELLTNDVVAIVAGIEPITRKIIYNAKSLKVISRCGIGLDSVDLEAANKAGITVMNTPDAPTRAVAELTLAHILSMLRRIPESDKLVKEGKWQPLMGSLLNKQTVGIIGYGRIGKMVASFLKPFGSKILAFDPIIQSNHDDIEMVALDKLLLESDVITLHIPYNQQTHHIINDAAIRKMKKNAFLVNIARGGLIDERALVAALTDKRLSGASLDCFDEEPYSGPLLQYNNVQVTAHMGSYAKEARMMMETEACVNLMTGLKKHGLL